MAPGRVDVRRAEAADVAVLAEVHLRSALFAYEGIFPVDAPKPTSESLAFHWHHAVLDPASEVFVAQVGEEVVGGVIATSEVRPGVGNLRHLYVDPPEWGRGAGRALHDAVVGWCADHGVAGLHLWVLEGNERAREMYDRWGWKLSPDDRYVHPGTGVAEVRYVLAMVSPP